MKLDPGTILRAAAFLAVAFIVLACKSSIDTTDKENSGEVPVQVVDDMLIVISDKGTMQLRVESPVMERYSSDSLEWELFPQGFNAYAYNEEGKLETSLRADIARHSKPVHGDEIWAAYGNVVIKNLIQRQTMETDTLYWDRVTEKIYTESYVRMYSPNGFMQGYGMESDQRGRNSIIKRPFNSYGLMDEDTTKIEVDTINFTGPFQKR